MRGDRFLTPADLLRAATPLFLLLGLIVTGAYVHASSYHPYLPKHYRIASSTNLPGKGVLHQCFPYARELQTQLYFEANLLSSLIFFNWVDEHGNYGTHVVVHYWDQHGNQWLADNQTPHPVAVYGEAPETLLNQLYPKLNIEVVRSLTDSL